MNAHMGTAHGKAAKPVDTNLRERAERVIPNGMWGHQRASALPDGYPQYYASGSGATVTDVDGNQYIDYMCAWGPVILGHRNPLVDAAAIAQIEAGDCLNGPTVHAVALAELMVDTIPHADWALFQKNGTDATTNCVTIARGTTKRRKILVAKGAYHGAVPWCTPSLVGVTAEDRAHLIHFIYNDVESLTRAAKEAGEDLAAILVSAFKHDLGIAQELPTREFAAACRTLCDNVGAALILDDVRAGFRMDLGGSWRHTGVEPDLAAFSKAIANGYALAAITGTNRFREAAGQAYMTGSFWYTGTSMAAAVANITELKRIDGPALMRKAGQRLRAGLEVQASRYGFELLQTGPEVMPLMQFAGDTDTALGARFCSEALKRGVYLHPKHNMFISCSHTDQVIDDTLNRTEEAFKAISKK